MAVRNFWVVVDVDGRQVPFGGGPRTKDGWMDVDLYQRQNGGGKDNPVLKIRCRTHGDKLVTRIIDPKKGILGEITTER